MSSPPRAAEPWTHAIGARRGRYEITERIARGGYGEVYAVRDELGARWAMKLAGLGHGRDPRVAERSVLEAALVKRIDHVNVVRYQDAFVDRDGAVVLVTELLAGRLLRELVDGGALGVERALRLGKQLADAAVAVHAIGAVHRDIKPENVFVIAGDIVKLFDFGLAKSAGVALKTTRPVGTPKYAAPDQLEFQPQRGAGFDPRWDVYAIGLVVFEMLAGCHPFDVDPERAPKTPSDVIERHLAGGVPRLDEVVASVSAPLADAIARAVARRPEERTPTAAVLAAELAAARRAWMAERAEDVPGITEELRRISLGAARRMEMEDDAPSSEDARTLERARPGSSPSSSAEDAPPRTERMAPSTDREAGPAPRSSTGRFGTEKMLPHIDRAALAKAQERKKRT